MLKVSRIVEASVTLFGGDPDVEFGSVRAVVNTMIDETCHEVIDQEDRDQLVTHVWRELLETNRADLS